MKTIILGAGERLAPVQLTRKGVLPAEIQAAARDIVTQVREGGDAALRRFEHEFDGVELARTASLIWVRLAEPGLYLTCDEEEGEGIFLGGEIYHVRGCAPLPGKETVTLDYIEE